MTGQTRRKPGVPAPAPQRTAAAHASGAQEFSHRFTVTARDFAGNPATFGDTTAGNGIAFSAGKAQRFGRPRLQNAYGPDAFALRVPVETQYWNGSSFVLNADDSCTALDREHIALSAYSQSLNACDTAIIEASATLSGGRATLTLAAAGAGNSGSVLLTPVLGAVGAEMYCPAKNGMKTAASSAQRACLQGAWTGAAWDDNPAAQAGFALYGSQPKNFIFFRENYWKRQTKLTDQVSMSARPVSNSSPTSP